ncbi:MAG TPA: DUF2828 domain-containing protein [Ruminococcus sp.]|nr:DUF2828 domain-containing protein [Ruminococcus sp.]
MTNFLQQLKAESNRAYTENGALTHRTSASDCLDLFFRMGGMRGAAEQDIVRTVLRAYAEDPLKTRKILFYGRDIRGGLGERRFFRTAIRALAMQDPEAVCRNLPLFVQYGRCDDFCALLDTPCEAAMFCYVRAELNADCARMAAGESVTLLAKWLPSVNASSKETCAMGRIFAKKLGMTPAAYRKTLSALRRHIGIIENPLRESDYTFDYETQTSGAMFKYRKAFLRNDAERYQTYIEKVHAHQAKINVQTLYPYQIVRACKGTAGAYSWTFPAPQTLPEAERRALDAAWKNLPVYGAEQENALVVVDGSGSMYGNEDMRPIDTALSLGIYFAEHNRGTFAGHFITFSRTPKLVAVKGRDIAEKVYECAKYNEVANTDLEAVFRLILKTAVCNRTRQQDMPATLYIISDMEFDRCIDGGNNRTLFEQMTALYANYGYRLPQVVFWNVASRNQNIPVTFTQTGAALVSGASPVIFNMVIGGNITPEVIMDQILENPRYAAVS